MEVSECVHIERKLGGHRRPAYIRAKAVVCFLRHLLNNAQDVARVCCGQAGLTLGSNVSVELDSNRGLGNNDAAQVIVGIAELAIMQ